MRRRTAGQFRQRIRVGITKEGVDELAARRSAVDFANRGRMEIDLDNIAVEEARRRGETFVNPLEEAAIDQLHAGEDIFSPSKFDAFLNGGKGQPAMLPMMERLFA
jgi:hypothetical protein